MPHIFVIRQIIFFSFKSEVALGLDFSFWAGSKNSRGFEVPEMGIGDLEFPKIPRKNPNPEDEGSGFLRRKNLGIFLPGIGDLFKSGDFYPRGWGFFKSGDFYPHNFRLILGIFAKFPGFLWMGIFYVGWDIPPKSHIKSSSVKPIRYSYLLNHLIKSLL